MKTEILNTKEITQLNKKELSLYINNKIINLMNKEIFKCDLISDFRYYDKNELNDYFKCLKKKEKLFVLGQTKVIEDFVHIFDVEINTKAYNFLRFYNKKVK